LPGGVEAVTVGDACFDSRTGELRRNGNVTRLTPKATALLAALVERAPELVTKAELLTRVWNGKAVGDEALSSCIQELRRALNDDSRRPRYIETLHRRGYRLIAPIGPPPASRPSGATGAMGKPSLAVLPFDDLSPDRDTDYFADGVVEDMTTALSRIGTFFVTARNSSFTFKGRKVQAQEVGRQLGVRYLVEGSVRRAGRKLRLTAQLIEAETGHHLWADRYDGELADVFSLQDRIVSRIVGAISPSVRAAEIERARLKRPDSLQAYDHVLRAYPGFWTIVDPGHADAIDLFHKALELEPAYALAMALAAWGHAQRFVRFMPGDPVANRRQAVDLANGALELAPDDPGVLVAAGMALLLAGSGDDADRCGLLFRRAVTLDPNSAPAWRRVGNLHIHRSEPIEAMDAFEQALRLSPFDPMGVHARWGIADVHLITGRVEEALRLYRQCLSETPRDPYFRRRVCALLALTGGIEQAKDMARELKADYPDVTLERIASVKPFMPAPVVERLIGGLRLAGFA
jgi:TolB-like protein